MKKSLRLAMLVVALMGCATLYAQDEIPIPTEPATVQKDDDVQARFRAILDIPLTKNLSLEWSEQARMHNNVSDLDKVISSVGINYKALPWLKVGASYGFVNVRDEEYDTKTKETLVEWQNRHMVNVDVTGSYKVGRVKLSLRERVRFNFRTDSVNKYEHSNPAISLRSRLKAAYDIRQCRWEPYAYVELYTTLNAVTAVPNYKQYEVAYKQYISRVRFSVGTEFKINNHNRLDFYYRFHMNQGYDVRYKGKSGDLKTNHSFNEKAQLVLKDPKDMGWRHEKQNCHVFGIDYKFKL